MKWLVCLVMPAIALGGCTGIPDAAWRGPTPIHGIVYGYSGVPLAGVMVGVNDTAPVHSDVRGRFTLAPLTPGGYEITAARPGYETLTSEIRIASRTDVVYLKLWSAHDLATEAQRALDRGSPDEATDLIDRAIRIDPKNPVLRYLGAISAAAAGNPLEGLSILAWFDDREGVPAVSLLQDRLTMEAGE